MGTPWDLSYDNLCVLCQPSNSPNIENFDVYGGLQIPGGISYFVSSDFPSNAVGIMSGDPFLTRVMSIFIKTYIFVKVREGKGRGGKGRKGREGKEGRKEGR